MEEKKKIDGWLKTAGEMKGRIEELRWMEEKIIGWVQTAEEESKGEERQRGGTKKERRIRGGWRRKERSVDEGAEGGAVVDANRLTTGLPSTKNKENKLNLT